MREKLNTWLVPLLAVTATYLACAFVSLGLLDKVQAALFPHLPNQYSLLYLPHGVRVLTAWLYGWRSVPLLLPGVVATYHLSVGEHEPTVVLFLSFVAAAASGHLAFRMLELAGHPARLDELPHREWRLVMVAAILASLINTVLPGWLWGVAGIGTLMFVIGDILGSLFLMVGLMFLFRWQRLKGR